MKVAAAIVLGLCGLASPALADGPAKIWSGFYLGGNAGFGTTNQSYTTTPQATLVSAPNINSTSWGAQSQATDSVALAGLQAGYNIEVGSKALIGLEAGAEALTAPNTLNYDFSTGSGGALVNDQISRSIPWLGTVQARLGTTILSPSVLLYVSGGVAYGHENIKATVNTATPFPGSVPLESFPFSVSADKTGVALGGGFEWLIGDRWSMKADFQSIRLPALSARTSVTTVFGPQSLPTDAVSFKPSAAQLNIVRLGVNYHFGGHAGK